MTKLAPRSVAAVIPTRGDVSIGQIADKLRQYPEIGAIHFIAGDSPFNRYSAMTNLAFSPECDPDCEISRNYEILYTQDDDCITDIGPLLESYEPDLIVNAMTPQHAAQYPGRQTLIGFGSIFHCSLLRCFTSYAWVRDALFYREADRIFAALNEHKTVFPEIEILLHAYNDNRMYREPGHLEARAAITQRILEMTGIEA